MAKLYNYDVMFDDTSIDVSKEVALVWSIANSLRGAYTSDKYKEVIIPMVIIRRFECALAETKQAVVDKFKGNPKLPAALLEKVSGYPFYNTSEFTLARLLNDSDNIAENFVSYIEGFSANVQTILANLEFKKQIEKMDKNNRLYGVVKKFSEIDFDPKSIDGMKMGYIFEDLIRRFSENAEAGDHYTPREVIRLLVNILLAEGCDDLLTEEGKIATVLDAACGSGGMLSTTHDFLARKNPFIDVRLFGQEINPESYATIAWLAHRLASLHDAQDHVIFDTVCIITDRIVVDRQLQAAVLGMEHKAGLVKVMDEKCTSKDLADALNGNTKIIVTTIHKFMYIHDLVQELKNKTFAVIIDEAHSSTAGTAMESVTYALSESRKLSEATPTETGEEEESMADIIEDEIARCGKQPNVSMIAFTATPKPTTLQLFGCLNEQGKKVAFDLYSMKQAIEEGFILDVLQNYVTYKTYYQINKAIEDDPELETVTAKRKIAKYIELHDTNIAQKVEIIIEHFKNNIMKELGGKAKAMVVTSSRQAAVKYRNEFVDYIARHGYTGIHALVAFSGKVTLDGKEYTEEVMNGISEEDLPEVFGTDSYQVLLVANKYQTGFDQPKLCAMYVDKRLRGVAAVQTLSRLNRICAPYNKKTFVLDFKNTYEDIQNAFAPYYTETVLNETITPSDIRAVEAQVDQYGFLDLDDIDTFNEYLYQDKRTAKDKAKMWSLLDKSLQIINKFPVLEKMEIRATIKRFIRFYSFLIQATCYENVDLHKKYNFLTYLVKEIEIGGGGNDFDIADKITASNFKQKMTGEETAPIESKPEVNLPKPNEVYFDEATKKKLSEIIDEINAAYNKNFDVDVASKSALQMRDLLLKNGHLRDSARNNTLKDFRFAYFDAVQDALLEGYEQNQEFFALLLDNDEKKRELMQVFLEDVYKNLRTE